MDEQTASQSAKQDSTLIFPRKTIWNEIPIYRTSDKLLMQNSVAMRLVPPDATIAALEKKATDGEETARKEDEPQSTKLKEEALLYREWITALRSGEWHA